MSSEYQKLQEYWNEVYGEEENFVREITDYKELIPSEKIYNALKLLAKKEKILDYGCGQGWASFNMIIEGAQSVLGVDTATNGIAQCNYIKEKYHLSNGLKFDNIDNSWLGKQSSESYDGIFCSNVVDVIPIDEAKKIITQFARISKKDALVVISLNYCNDFSKANSNPNVVMVDNKVYVNGILRLESRTDEQWEAIFEPYFIINKLIHYGWPNETDERRRLFYLRRK